MKVIFTNIDEIKYIKALIIEDIEQLQKKLQRREKILTQIYFDEELDGF